MPYHTILASNCTLSWHLLTKLAYFYRSRYGPIFGLWFGSQRTVVLTSLELFQQVMGRDELTGRPPFPAAQEVRGTTRWGEWRPTDVQGQKKGRGQGV